MSRRLELEGAWYIQRDSDHKLWSQGVGWVEPVHRNIGHGDSETCLYGARALVIQGHLRAFRYQAVFIPHGRNTVE